MCNGYFKNRIVNIQHTTPHVTGKGLSGTDSFSARVAKPRVGNAGRFVFRADSHYHPECSVHSP